MGKEVHDTYETNRREATEEVLDQVAAAMRSVAPLRSHNRRRWP